MQIDVWSYNMSFKKMKYLNFSTFQLMDPYNIIYALASFTYYNHNISN